MMNLYSREAGDFVLEVTGADSINLSKCRRSILSDNYESTPTLYCDSLPVFAGVPLIQEPERIEQKRETSGNYCWVYQENKSNVVLECDSSGILAIFVDAEDQRLSTSQQKLVSNRKFSLLNHSVLCEQLIIGAAAGDETLFRGIKRLKGPEEFNLGKTFFKVETVSSNRTSAPEKFSSFDACVDFQIETLQQYFQRIKEFAGDSPVSMGLSGGYDSRLMLLLAADAEINVQPFTFTSNAHGRESRHAATVAKAAGLNLRQIPVRPIEHLNARDLESNIDDALAYYDGRTNETMGTFADVHTARIQRACVGDAVLNLNGLGGELYRNRERLPFYDFSFKDWLRHYVIGPNGRDLFTSSRKYRLFEERIAREYADILGVDKLSRFNRYMARRYYRDIWLPYFAGPRLSAENRVSSSLMPFADATVSAAALNATPFIGSHGEFEAAMIRRLDRRIASLPSSYGHGFAKTPLKNRLRDLAFSCVPIATRLARHNFLNHINRAKCRDSEVALSELWRKRFHEPLRLLRSLELPIDIDQLLSNQVSRDRTLYIAAFLHRNREHINFDA